MTFSAVLEKEFVVRLGYYLGLLCGICFSLSLSAQPIKAERSIAFYYGSHLPLEEAALYPKVVVQPRVLKTWQLDFLKNRQTLPYVYISVGEAEGDEQPDAPSLVVNQQWQSRVMDLTNEAWQEHLFAKTRAYMAEGYQGVFLDTLDSYQLGDAAKHPAQQAALVHIIQTLSEITDKRLILNRGFELLEALQGVAPDLIAEGLLSHYDNARKHYGKTTEQDQVWLLARLKKAQQLGYQVQVLDYAQDQSERTAMAQALAKFGFNAWVADGQLATWGTSELIPVPRKIMGLYDSRDEKYVRTQIHKHMSALIEYLGYQVEYFDLNQGVPPAADPAVYAGIIFWPRAEALYTVTTEHWLTEQLGKVPMLLLGAAPQTPALLNAFAIAPISAEAPFSVNYFDERLNAEVPVRWDRQDIDAFKHLPNDESVALFTLTDRQGQSVAQVVKSRNGLIAPGLWPLDILPNGIVHWRLNPMFLLRYGLGLSDIPAPDVTTESGRRLLLTHIDGDGFPSKAFIPGTPLVPKVVLDKVLRKYRLPTTVSVIEAEVGPTGLYPKQSPKLEKLAREIFAEPYVELASHSFSHPFFWQAASGKVELDESETLYGFHLDVPGYEFSVEREVKGSIDYINRALAPAGKEVKVMLWTGDAIARDSALQQAAKMGVVNVNGGVTFTDKNYPSLSRVWPIGRKEEQGLYQIYAPIMNENVYTNDWTGPFYGFRDVIETFQYTDTPYRLKPMNIYYHFYSGTYPASVNALKLVYEYAMRKPHTPAYLSEYAPRALDFYQSALAKDVHGRWYLQSQNLKTVRLPDELGIPRPRVGVAGFHETKQGRYLHVTGTDPVIEIGKVNKKTPYIAHANVLLEAWQPSGKKTALTFTAHMSAEIIFKQAKGCVFVTDDQRFPVKAIKGGYQLTMPAGRYQGQLHCE